MRVVRLEATVAADDNASSAVTFDLTVGTTVVWEEDGFAVRALLGAGSSDGHSGEGSEDDGGEFELHVWLVGAGVD